MIKSVQLRNFRVYENQKFDFKPGLNLIVGPNGIGKTTILEAIYATLRGGSWRGRDDILIKHGADWARVDATMENKDVYSLLLDRRSGLLQKSRLFNNERLKDPPPAVVLFEPDFIRALTGPPDLRRAWLDELITQLKPDYAQTIKRFKRALSQRNRLLKQAKIDQDSLFVWNLKLSELGMRVAQERQALVMKITPLLHKEYKRQLNDQITLELNYQLSFPLDDYASLFVAALEQNAERDRLLGFTGAGPHREDLIFKLDNKPLVEEASRGQTRLVASSLKVVERQIIKKNLGQNPLILFDDIMSELDKDRSQAVAFNLPSSQTIITSAIVQKIALSKTYTIRLR